MITGSSGFNLCEMANGFIPTRFLWAIFSGGPETTEAWLNLWTGYFVFMTLLHIFSILCSIIHTEIWHRNCVFAPAEVQSKDHGARDLEKGQQSRHQPRVILHKGFGVKEEKSCESNSEHLELPATPGGYCVSLMVVWAMAVVFLHAV